MKKHIKPARAGLQVRKLMASASVLKGKRSS